MATPYLAPGYFAPGYFPPGYFGGGDAPAGGAGGVYFAGGYFAPAYWPPDYFPGAAGAAPAPPTPAPALGSPAAAWLPLRRRGGAAVAPPGTLAEAICIYLKAQPRLSGINVWGGGAARVNMPLLIVNVISGESENNHKGDEFPGFDTAQFTVLCSRPSEAKRVMHAARGLFKPRTPTFAWADDYHAGATAGNVVGKPLEWLPPPVGGNVAPANVRHFGFTVAMYATRKYI